jgi:hypothetical protein
MVSPIEQGNKKSQLVKVYTTSAEITVVILMKLIPITNINERLCFVAQNYCLYTKLNPQYMKEV